MRRRTWTAVVRPRNRVTALPATVALRRSSRRSSPPGRSPTTTLTSTAATRGTFATAQLTVPAGNGFGGGYLYTPPTQVAIVSRCSALFANEEAWMGPGWPVASSRRRRCRPELTRRKSAGPGEFNLRRLMLDDERVEIVELLQPGVTRPHVDHAARASWLAAVHEAMRSVGGAVFAAEEPAVGRNFYRVRVEARDGVAGFIVFNAAALLVAAAEAADPQQIVLVFAAVPGHEVFSARGLQVASPAQLNEPLRERHLHALTADERHDVAYHRPSRLGDLLFNWFD